MVGIVLASTVIAATLFSSTPPADAADAAEVTAVGRVSGGLYSSEWWVTDDLDALAAATGKRVTFGATFHNIYDDGAAPASWSNPFMILDKVWLGKATPFANVAINTSAYRIASGAYDAKIAEWASHVKEFLDLGGGRTLIIAPLQEMNYGPTPWGCDPGNYKIAYRKFVDTFRSMGMDETKVRWAFAPNSGTSPRCGSISDYYPGDAYVDVIGISAYNWGTCVGSGWETPAQVYGRALNEIRTTVNATKPYIIAQTAASRYASCGGSQDQWVRDAFAYVAADPNAVGLLWFNFHKETDWRVWTKPTVTAGWKDAMMRSSTIYEWPLTSWFQPGDLTVTMPEGPGNDVTVLGGSAAVSDAALYDIAATLGGMPDRIAGMNRYATAARVSNEYFAPGVEAVYVATATGYADALSAGAAAANAGGPLLLVSKDTIPTETRAELARLQPRQIIVAGGSAVVSQGVLDALGPYAASGKAIRVAGANRYSTAAAVVTTAFPNGVNTIYLATGRGFADALSAGAAAAAVEGAVLLTEPDHLPPEISSAIRTLGSSEIILVGGTAALSSALESELRSLGVANVRRISGSNRYATSAAISADAFGPIAPVVLLATGATFPDALAGAAAAGELGVPLLLTEPAGTPSVIINELRRLLE